MPTYDLVGFHAQQAAEKAVKALLVRHQRKFPKSHEIAELLELAESVVPGIERQLADAKALTPYAVDTRYPVGGPPLDQDEAIHHLAVARRTLDHVHGLLARYLDAGRPGKT